jgi:hypothetical protein
VASKGGAIMVQTALVKVGVFIPVRRASKINVNRDDIVQVVLCSTFSFTSSPTVRTTGGHT